MEQERYNELQKTSLMTIIVNAIMCLGKVGVGLLVNSTAVISDGIHTFSDVFTTVMVMVGLKFSSKEDDEEHQYGHQRIESIVSLLLAVSLGATAVYLGYTGVFKLSQGEIIEPSVLSLVVTVLSIAFKEWMFRYTMAAAKKHNSSSMAADAWHHRTDAISSLAVLVGVGGSFFGLWFMDPIAAIAVCLIILKAAWDIGATAVNQLMDRSVDTTTTGRIREITHSVEGVLRIDLLKTRLSNNIVFVELEIAVDPNISVCQGHDIAKNIHDRLESLIPQIRHCMVHVNPLEQ